MKKVVCLVLLAGVVLFAYGCRKDVFVQPPPSLSGDYEGIIIQKYEGQTESSQYITWRFSTTGYQMRMDEDKGGDRFFCDNVGTYEFLGSRVEMETTIDNLNADVCSPDANPSGQFSVFQPTVEDDTLKLIQLIDDLTVTIKLVPVFE